MRYDKLEEIIEKNGFFFKHKEEQKRRYYALLEQSTPLGEDWCMEFIYKNISDLIQQICEYAEGYNVDDEAEIYIEIRGKHGVPNSIKELINDSQWKKDKFAELASQLTNPRKEKTQKKDLHKMLQKLYDVATEINENTDEEDYEAYKDILDECANITNAFKNCVDDGIFLGRA